MASVLVFPEDGSVTISAPAVRLLLEKGEKA